MIEMSHFAKSILEQKYAQAKSDGSKESWEDVSRRVARNIIGKVFPEDVERMEYFIASRKFMPGGRYLYASGRDFQQIANCFTLKAEDSREGWAKLLYDATHSLMSGGGIGVNYSDVRPRGATVGGLGGICTGPLALMEAVNETARQIQAGGSRRSAVYSSLHWWHPDVFDFIKLKDWPENIVEAKAKDFNARAPMDMTNISVALDDDFFDVMEGKKQEVSRKIGNDEYVADQEWAQKVYSALVANMLKTGEPGIQIDVGENAGEILRNACLPAESRLLSKNKGLITMGQVKTGDVIWSKDGWVTVKKKWNKGVKQVYAAKTSSGTLFATGDHEVEQKGVKVELLDAKSIDTLELPDIDVEIPHDPKRVMDGLVFGDGFRHKASKGQPFLSIGDKDHDYFSSEVSSLIGDPMSDSDSNRDYRVEVSEDALFEGSVTTREIPESITSGDLSTKASWLRGLFTANGSVTKNTRVSLKTTNSDLAHGVQAMLWELGIQSYLTFNKAQEITWSNGTFISKDSVDLNINNAVSLERFSRYIGFIQKYKTEALAEVEGSKRSNSRKILDMQSVGKHEVFDIEVSGESHTFWTDGLSVSNCTELTTYDNLDICNLGSVNLANIESIEEMEEAVELGTKFLLAGTIVGAVPNEEVRNVRDRTRRLGLGLMGLYDWLVARGKPYAIDDELGEWLSVYRDTSRRVADESSEELGVSTPVKVRAIAPTGTIGILAETTSGIEPLFASAYKRRYLKGSDWHFQYVVDAGAQRLQDKYGVHPDKLETAYDLAYDPERRIAFQAWVQEYVDHGISSTLNLPSVDEHALDPDRFASMLYKYLPKLRGLTAYPDGARGGQPLTVVSYAEAAGFEGIEFEEYGAENACVGGVCGV